MQPIKSSMKDFLLSILFIFKYHVSLYLLPSSLLLFWIKLLQKLYALPVAIFSLLIISRTHSSLLLFLPLHWNSSFLTWHLAEFINFFSLKHLPPFPLSIQSLLVFLLTQWSLFSLCWSLFLSPTSGCWSILGLIPQASSLSALLLERSSTELVSDYMTSPLGCPIGSPT